MSPLAHSSQASKFSRGENLARSSISYKRMALSLSRRYSGSGLASNLRTDHEISPETWNFPPLNGRLWPDTDRFMIERSASSAFHAVGLVGKWRDLSGGICIRLMLVQAEIGQGCWTAEQFLFQWDCSSHFHSTSLCSRLKFLKKSEGKFQHKGHTGIYVKAIASKLKSLKISLEFSQLIANQVALTGSTIRVSEIGLITTDGCDVFGAFLLLVGEHRVLCNRWIAIHTFGGENESRRFSQESPMTTASYDPAEESRVLDINTTTGGDNLSNASFGIGNWVFPVGGSRKLKVEAVIWKSQTWKACPLNWPLGFVRGLVLDYFLDGFEWEENREVEFDLQPSEVGNRLAATSDEKCRVEELVLHFKTMACFMIEENFGLALDDFFKASRAFYIQKVNHPPSGVQMNLDSFEF
ncbi:hypothetical protein Tco_0548615 [Tanacetum coccineum]